MCWVFFAEQGLARTVASGGKCGMGFSLRRLLFLGSAGSGIRASAVVAQGMVALGHVGSSQNGDWTRGILLHPTTREVFSERLWQLSITLIPILQWGSWSREVYNKPKILKPVTAGLVFEARLSGFWIRALNLHAPLPWNKAQSGNHMEISYVTLPALRRQCHHLHWKVMSLWANPIHHFLMMWNQIGLIFILADIWWKLCLRPAVLKLLLTLVPCSIFSSAFSSFWECALNCLA